MIRNFVLATLAFAMTAYLPVHLACADRAPTGNKIDNAILAKLAAVDLNKSNTRQAYATFFRRIQLDLVGTVPTQDETRAFLDASAADRAATIRKLVADSAAQHWPGGDQKRINDALIEALLGLDQ